MGKILETLHGRELAVAPPPSLGAAKLSAVAEALRPALDRPFRPVCPPLPAAEVPVPEPAEVDIPFYEIPEMPGSKPAPPRPAVKLAESPAQGAAAPPIAASRPADAPKHPGADAAGAAQPPPPQPALAFRLPPLTLPPLPSHIAPELIVWTQPRSGAAEQYRQVCGQLVAQVFAHQVRSVLLVRLDASAAAAAVVNLALALTEWGARSVLLIDADRRTRRADVDGSPAKLLSLAAAPGWSEVLAGLPLAQAIQETDWERLHVLAAGHRLAGTASALHAAKVRQLLQGLKEQYDLVVVRSPIWNDGITTLVLAQACDASALVLAKPPATETPEKTCLEALQRERVRVLGSVLVSNENLSS